MKRKHQQNASIDQFLGRGMHQIDTTDCKKLDWKPLKVEKPWRRPGSEDYKGIPSLADKLYA